MKYELKLKLWQRLLLFPVLYLGLLTVYTVAVILGAVALVVGLPAAILIGKFYITTRK